MGIYPTAPSMSTHTRGHNNTPRHHLYVHTGVNTGPSPKCRNSEEEHFPMDCDYCWEDFHLDAKVLDAAMPLEFLEGKYD